MKLYAPRYYLDFACIAGKCRHSCCIGWEIDVDEQTMALYEDLEGECGARIRASIDRDGTPHFRLTPDERCPHLDACGLCRIILSLGENYLCNICREHPRFYHTTSYGMEVGLGMACEEACRLILSSDLYTELVEIDEWEGKAEPSMFDALAHRARVYELLSDRSMPYERRLTAISHVHDISLTAQTDDEWRMRLSALEYLDEAHRVHFSCFSAATDTPHEWENTAERALAYFVFRHCSDARDVNEFREGLGFALLCERLLVSLIRHAAAATASDVCELARLVSEELEYSEDNTQSLRGMF